MNPGEDVGVERLSESILRAMNAVPRGEFVPADLRPHADEDRPLPIGHGQTISQPYIVGRMTELADVGPGSVVLEIGTGSGYQAAVLAELADRVYTIEIVEALGIRARETLERLGYDNVAVRIGDGSTGWESAAPFDAIVITAAPEKVPRALIDQLAVGGRMVVPVGPTEKAQSLRLIEKLPGGETTVKDVLPVRFVPFTGGN